MSWKWCVLPAGQSYMTVIEAIHILADEAGHPPEIALFGRLTEDRTQRILLISPLAADLAGDCMPPRWTACDTPADFAWELLFGAQESFRRLGLKKQKFAQRFAPPRAASTEDQRPAL